MANAHLTRFAGTRLRMELDKVPLWSGNDVAIKQLVEHFARYLYLPRLKDSSVLMGAIRDGSGLLTWEQESFGFADSLEEATGRYRGLRGGQLVALGPNDTAGLLVRPEVARKLLEADRAIVTPPPLEPGAGPGQGPEPGRGPAPLPPFPTPPAPASQPKRFHGTVTQSQARGLP